MSIFLRFIYTKFLRTDTMVVTAFLPLFTTFPVAAATFYIIPCSIHYRY
ncbi:hypothetical protein NIASO_13120 [Niabella soli DSM 19437]|uniref:Uncharacterized protein n=1 Tax=Niabella soli DSM 19437 TaxID=929713 RepID=W0F3V4_9BACT|nr:hypothetical protein NIASO_13120 [Niabella soli DSM 19437]